MILRMRLNEKIKIIGSRVVLIPYESKHVEKYHSWMQSAELQELTASEPLSIEEEYKMQRTWREDDDKCTFLILDKEKYSETNDEIYALIGDTNLFISEEDNERVAEVEIMIAEAVSQRKGFGFESCLIMLKYGIEEIRINSFKAIVSEKNIKSIAMFNKMNFEEYSRTKVFQEITFKRPVTDDWRNWLNASVPNYTLENYSS